MADGRDRRETSSTRRPAPRPPHRVRAVRAAPVDEWLMDELRQVGRELLDEPVPPHLLDLLRAGRDRQE
jgi:hypothetical protein